MAVVETDDVFLEGCVYYKKGNYEEALKNFEAIWNSNPEHFDNLAMLSSVLTKVNRFEEALSVCDEALSLKDDDVTLLNNKGYVLSLLGENQKAIDIFDKIIKKEPENIAAYFNKALCLSRLQKFIESVEVYEKILQLNDKHVEALFNRGNDLYQLGRYDDAIKSYERVLQIESKHNGAQNNKSLALSKLDEEKNPLPTDSISNSKANNEKLITKLRKWIDAGRPNTNDFEELLPLNTPLIEHLPEDNEEAIKIIDNFEKWIKDDMPAIDLEDPEIDPIVKQMATAMTYFDSNAKNERDKKIKEAKKKKFPKPSKTKSVFLALIFGTLVIAAYDAYPQYFEPEYLKNLGVTSVNFAVSELPIPTAEEKVVEVIEPFKAVISENTALEKEIEDVFNQKRIEIGRGIFVTHPELTALALRHSQDMAANNRVSNAMSFDGLSVAREYADKLSFCIEHSARLETNTPKSGINVFGGNIPIDELTSQEIVQTWLDKDVRENILRNSVYENVGTGVSISEDQTIYVSQIYC